MSDPLLSRAAAELAAAPEPQAATLGDRVVSLARRTARRSWWLHSAFPDGVPGESPDLTRDARDELRVTDRAVISALRAALSGVAGVRPVRVDLDVDGHDCRGAALGVAVRYGTNADAAADLVRAVAAAVLSDTLGLADGEPPLPVDVRIEDVDPA